MRYFFAGLLVLLPAFASAEPPVELDLVPTRVAMFKNGYGIVTAEAALPDAAGPVRLAPLPEASLGSFWLHWPEGVSIEGVTSRYAERTQAVPAASIGDLLAANVGKPIEILVADEWLAGTLQALPEPPAPDTPDPRNNPHTRSTIYPPPSPEPTLLLLAQGDGVRAVQIRSVQQVRLTDQPGLSYERTTREPVLEMHVGGNLGGDGDRPATLGVEYTASGITWSPSYQVQLTDAETARISAKAVIVNDLLHLNETDVELITGYPHLSFADSGFGLSLTPISVFLQSLRENGRREADVMMNNVAMQQARYSGGFDNDAPGMPTDPVLGESAEDLYFYQLPAVTLARGERGYFPLFAADVPYQHCYTWDIPDFVEEDNRYRNAEEYERQEIVWHAVRLKNTTEHPWTTAPGQTTRGGRLLGQDTLHYTTPGTSTDLKITQALAIRAQQNEQETDRQRNATKFYGYNYDKVTIKGELAVTNHKTEAVTVSIKKLLSGEVIEADADPKVSKLATGLRRVNPRSELLWEVDVEPGEDGRQTVAYTYEVYVRN